ANFQFHFNGYCLKEKKGCSGQLMVFFIILLIILLAELILLILFFVYMDKVNENNIIQEEMHCCGVTDYTDWFPVLGTNVVPDRCCMENSQDCGRNSTDLFEDNKHVLGTAGMCILIITLLFDLTMYSELYLHFYSD
uniref:Tetraspanin n=1 Tax=Chelonoidis abingdonii TaxID=106734 RepID=A0A8C0G9F1_CHEAB